VQQLKHKNKLLAYVVKLMIMVFLIYNFQKMIHKAKTMDQYLIQKSLLINLIKKKLLNILMK